MDVAGRPTSLFQCPDMNSSLMQFPGISGISAHVLRLFLHIRGQYAAKMALSEARAYPERGEHRGEDEEQVREENQPDWYEAGPVACRQNGALHSSGETAQTTRP